MSDILSFGDGTPGKAGGISTYGSCYKSHKPLPVTIDGKQYEVYGTSVTKWKVTKDHTDILISLDGSAHLTELMHPWVDGEQWHFMIRDMGVPDKVGEFRKLLKHMKEEVVAGRRVMVGCIGGHGRTGLVLAAFLAHCEGRKDAIQFVRNNYCKKAVESDKQIKWLVKHFKVSTAKATKGSYRGSPKKGSKGTTGELFGKASNYRGPVSSQSLASKEDDWDAWTKELDDQYGLGVRNEKSVVTQASDILTRRGKADKHVREEGSERSIMAPCIVRDLT